MKRLDKYSTAVHCSGRVQATLDSRSATPCTAMQASDYTSAARSLAQPLSSRSSSPSPNRTSPIPPRTRRSASPDQSRRNRRTSWQRINPEPPRASRCAHRATQLLVEGQKLRRHGMKQFKKLARWQQIGAILLSAILLLCSILFLVFNERIFAWLVPFAKGWRAMTAGWVISFIFTFICAFPPVIGYSMSLTVAGFVFGFPRG